MRWRQIGAQDARLGERLRRRLVLQILRQRLAVERSGFARRQRLERAEAIAAVRIEPYHHAPLSLIDRFIKEVHDRRITNGRILLSHQYNTNAP